MLTLALPRESGAQSAIADQLAQIVAKSLGRPVLATDTWAELGVDSLGMAEMMTEVETRFDVRLDERVFEIESVAGMAEFIAREQQAK